MAEEVKRKRGRPRKPPEPPKPKRPRGRPRKDVAQIQEPPKPRVKDAKDYQTNQTIMTDSAMDRVAIAAHESNLLYSKQTDGGEKISILVHSLKDEIINATRTGIRIQLSDTDMVKDTALRYLQSCERVGTLPTKTGFARACGVSSIAFDNFMRRHDDHPTTAFLRILLEGFSDALTQASLSGSVQPIVAIFLQKALYRLRENEIIEPPKEDVLGETTDPRKLMEKYAELKFEDDNDEN